MLGVVVNAVAVIIGSAIGLFIKKGVSERLSTAVMSAIGLCVILVGIDGMLGYGNMIVLILSMAVGTLAGTALSLDEWLESFGDKVSAKFSVIGQSNRLSEGFVTASLLFCVGAMAVTGSAAAGLSGDNIILLTKSVMDFFRE